MSSALSSAAEFVTAVAKEYAGKPHEELLALPPVASIQRPDCPAGFEIEIECLPLLNAACAITVEAAAPYLFGFRWRNVVSGFEVTPEGEVAHYPQRVTTESAKERARRKAWRT